MDTSRVTHTQEADQGISINFHSQGDARIYRADRIEVIEVHVHGAAAIEDNKSQALIGELVESAVTGARRSTSNAAGGETQ